MKKSILVILAFLILALFLPACLPRNAKEVIAPTTEAPVVTDASTPEPVADMYSNWEIDNYVDDFGDKTGSAYLRGTFRGKYSNSLTSSNDLKVYFYYDGESKLFVIRLLEYGSYKATFSAFDDVIMKVKIDGAEYTIDLTIPNSGEPYFSSSDFGYSVIKNALLNGKEIKCVIKSSLLDQTYNFTIDGIGFKETLEKAGMN